MSTTPTTLPPKSLASIDQALLAPLRSSSPKSLWLLGIWVAYSMFLGGIYIVMPPSPDQSIFDYIGWRVLSGDTLYVDVTEQNWPGAMWLHTLSTWLFGNHLWSFRLLDYTILMAASFGLLLLGASSGIRWTGFIAVPLYQMMYVTSSLWATGQRDIVAAHALILLTVLYLRDGAATRLLRMCLFGGGIALVTMTRPTYLLFPVSLLALELVASYRWNGAFSALAKDVGAALFGAAATLISIIAYGAFTGGLKGWYESAVLFNLSAYSGSATHEQVIATLVDTVRSWHWYYAFSVFGAVLWLTLGSHRTLRALFCLVLTVLVSFAVQGKAFGYHLYGLMPVLALLCSQAIAWALDAIRRRRAPLIFVAAAAILAVGVAGSLKKMYSSLGSQLNVLTSQIDYRTYLNETGFSFEGMKLGDAVDVSSFLSSSSQPDDTVLVWGRGIVVNFLSERRSPVPQATIGMLRTFQKKTPLSDSWLKQLDHTLKCTPPKFIVLGVESDVSDRLAQKPAKESADIRMADEVLMKAISTTYHRDRTIGGGHVWALNDQWRPSC
jgi:hypothetical protein